MNKGRILGIGGVFFKGKDRQKLMQWYNENLGLNVDEYGTSFEFRNANNPDEKNYAAWSIFGNDTDYLNPSNKEFMINYRVENIEELMQELKLKGVQVVGEIEELEYGKFAWAMDPEGNKLEFWEADNVEYEKMIHAVTK